MHPNILFNQKNRSVAQNFSPIDQSYVDELQLPPKNPPPVFHLECPVSNKRICYCKHSMATLHPNPYPYANYLKNYFSGFTLEDYSAAFDQKRHNQYKFHIFLRKNYERIKYCQEPEDLFELCPKLKRFEDKQKEQDDLFEQEVQRRQMIRRKQLEKLESGKCDICNLLYSHKFYEIEKEGLILHQYINIGEKIQICHDCAKISRPELITRTHLEESLLHKRGKVPIHLQPLKEKFKNKKLLKLQQKDKTKEENLNQSFEQEYIASPKSKAGTKNEINEQEDIKICYNPVCDKLTELDQILTCKSCERTFHSGCLDQPLEFNLVNRFDWFCTDCKLCIICWKSGNENELLFCDCCDRAYHIQCIKPKILKIPEGKWFCLDCEQCASCKIQLMSNQNFSKELMEKYAKQNIDQKLICDKCWKFYEDKNYCPVCYRIIQSDAEGNYVWCDLCELWIHFECEKIPQKELQKIQLLSSYTCQRCSAEQRKEQAKKVLEEKLKAQEKQENIQVKTEENMLSQKILKSEKSEQVSNQLNDQK